MAYRLCQPRTIGSFHLDTAVPCGTFAPCPLTLVRYGRIVSDPLTGRTTERGARAGDMAVAVLTYANRAKVAEALTEQGYPVSRVTVSRWARGGEMPEIAARMILELFGHTPNTTKEAAPPEWAERLFEKVDAMATDQRTIAEEAVSSAVRAIAPLPSMESADQMIALLEERLRRRAEARPETEPEPGPGAAGPQDLQVE
jgi:hypothetical protein